MMSVPSTPSRRPAAPIDAHGAIDLSAFARPSGGAAAKQPEASTVVLDVTEADFAEVVGRSDQVPVVITLWTAVDPASSAVTALLAELATELQGRLLLARVDVERAPQVAQAVGTQTGSTVAAVVKGQAVPLPPLDSATREQVRAVLDQVLQMAVANGVTGRVDAPAPEPDDAEPPLPPLHAEAYEAIERDDLDGAVAAYTAALAQDPRDEMARAGLAQVGLLRRVRDADAAEARGRAAAEPDDLDAQLLVADLDVIAGAVEAAFTRLLDAVRRTVGPERERVRAHLVELFTVVGDHDPRVTAARRQLANALY
jgi:putative thioredoxin